ncbi:hypothetical protein [Solitalea lacus]|uniref:hypothetical protein n=1 Tax=Solitalea lacus TaxID=2911172 RepID=UPI001EDA4B3A|nr:hypothetical protein [Solitalea lacus]UKJ06473.1 hypothetical protein L2B55_13125 [Solitalea lacus]
MNIRVSNDEAGYGKLARWIAGKSRLVCMELTGVYVFGLSIAAVYDKSNYGIYKGVFTGSSGNIVINIKADGSATATLIIDGQEYVFASSGTIKKDSDSQVIFTNQIGSFVFSVKADGSSPSFSAITIAGHSQAGIAVIKETSEHVVHCYEGKAYYNNEEGATFNFVVTDNKIEGLVKSHSDRPHMITGTFVNNAIDCMIDDGVNFKGTISGNTATGTWKDVNPQSDEFGIQGTWSATKKM